MSKEGNTAHQWPSMTPLMAGTWDSLEGLILSVHPIPSQDHPPLAARGLGELETLGHLQHGYQSTKHRSVEICPAVQSSILLDDTLWTLIRRCTAQGSARPPSRDWEANSCRPWLVTLYYSGLRYVTISWFPAPGVDPELGAGLKGLSDWLTVTAEGTMESGP